MKCYDISMICTNKSKKTAPTILSVINPTEWQGSAQLMECIIV